MRQLDENALWKRVSKIIHELPYTIEIPLSFIEQSLWPTADSNELKFKGKILSHLLRTHQAKIVKRGGVRYAIFPKRILDEAKRRRSRKRPERERIMVEAAWPW